VNNQKTLSNQVQQHSVQRAKSPVKFSGASQQSPSANDQKQPGNKMSSSVESMHHQQGSRRQRFSSRAKRMLTNMDLNNKDNTSPFNPLNPGGRELDGPPDEPSKFRGDGL